MPQPRRDDPFDRMEKRMDKMLDHPVRTGVAAVAVGILLYLVAFAALVAIVLVGLKFAGVI